MIVVKGRCLECAVGNVRDHNLEKDYVTNSRRRLVQAVPTIVEGICLCRSKQDEV